jgi:CheY-like chemotaxis protein
MSKKRLEGLRILIVEDTADTAMSLSVGLRRAGAASVELKASVFQARRRLQQPPSPDLVLIDNDLFGKETGMDLAHWMREQPNLTNTLRISFSGSDPELLKNRWSDEQLFHAIISKPTRLESLVEQLASISLSAPAT